VLPSDKRLINAAWEHLSEESRRKRFLAPKPHLTTSDLRYLTEIDGHDHIALIAVLAEDWHRPVAVARCVRLSERPDTAEVAITVDDEYQGRGVGRQMGLLLADEARTHGIRSFSAEILADNAPALRLMRTISDRLSDQSAGYTRTLVAELAA
jgi:GNAT superfamily N-acetyltransferase